MRYLIETARRIVYRAVDRQSGVRRGSRISHVTAAADTDDAAGSAATATSAADPNDIVIAPVHPAAKKTSGLPSSLSRARSTKTILSRTAPSRTSAAPRSKKHPFAGQSPLHESRRIAGSMCRKQLRRDSRHNCIAHQLVCVCVCVR